MVEVEVKAETVEGEGPPSGARVTLTATISAAIYSVGGSVKAIRGEDVTLLCGHVGDPKPRLSWTYQGQPIVSGSHLDVSRGGFGKVDGGLVIKDAQRINSGNYTCTVSNIHGTDHVTYHLAVLGKKYSQCPLFMNFLIYRNEKNKEKFLTL